MIFGITAVGDKKDIKIYIYNSRPQLIFVWLGVEIFGISPMIFFRL